MRWLCFWLLSAVLWFVPAFAAAQDLPAGVLQFSLEEGRVTVGQIIAVSENRLKVGNLRLVGVPGDPQPELSEGYYLALVADQFDGSLEGALVFRAFISNVGAHETATLKVAPAVAEQVAKGNQLALMRPPRSTTSQLQSLPDAVRIGGSEEKALRAEVAGRMMGSFNNLREIGIALHNFHDIFRGLPPAVIYGPDGKPWHSWRVVILPLLQEHALYEQYRFDEPWDGPNNSQLLQHMPAVYQDPVHGETGSTFTHYAAAVGEGTAWPVQGMRFDLDGLKGLNGVGFDMRPAVEGTPLVFQDFTDGTSNSLLVGSVSPNLEIPWMKPVDVEAGELLPPLGDENGFAAPYEMTDAAAGVFLRGDCSVTSIRTGIDPQTWANLWLISDGNIIDHAKIPSVDPPSRRRGRAMLEITTGANPRAVLTFARPASAVPTPPVTSETERAPE